MPTYILLSDESCNFRVTTPSTSRHFSNSRGRLSFPSSSLKRRDRFHARVILSKNRVRQGVMLKGGREAVGGEISPNHSPSLILITRNVASSCVTEITDSLWCARSTKVSVNFGTQEPPTVTTCGVCAAPASFVPLICPLA